MPTKKERLDQLILKLGLVESRSKAQALIMEGKILVNDEKICKCGTKVDASSDIHILEQGKRWVSRGAYKLIKALAVFPVNANNAICMDVGASTGGFTEVLLSSGALRVYSVDVGYGQLAWKLRQDPRVIVLERENARYLEPGNFTEKIDLITIDASFISLKLLLPPLSKLLSQEGRIIALLKPQFEAGRSRVGKNGVVKSAETHKEIIKDIENFIRADTGLCLESIDYSPIMGPKGNIEFLLFIAAGHRCNPEPKIEFINDTVDKAHRNFMKG